MNLGSRALSLCGSRKRAANALDALGCDNPQRLETDYQCDVSAQSMDEGRTGFAGLRLQRRMLMWLVLSVLAGLIVYFGFRGYLNPELLFHFSNSLYC